MDWFKEISNLSTLIIAILAFLVSLISFIYSRRLHADAVIADILDKQYNAFNEIIRMCVENYSLIHLFELNDNYPSTIKISKKAMESLSKAELAARMLQERAIALYIFQSFEHTYYQYLNAIEKNDAYRSNFLKEVLDYFTTQLLMNPRLLYYWETTGGNLVIHLEKSTRNYYYEKIPIYFKEKIEEIMDKEGPFQL